MSFKTSLETGAMDREPPRKHDHEHSAAACCDSAEVSHPESGATNERGSLALELAESLCAPGVSLEGLR